MRRFVLFYNKRTSGNQFQNQSSLIPTTPFKPNKVARVMATQYPEQLEPKESYWSKHKKIFHCNSFISEDVYDYLNLSIWSMLNLCFIVWKKQAFGKERYGPNLLPTMAKYCTN